MCFKLQFRKHELKLNEMKENIEYYTFSLLQFCPVIFAILVLIYNREKQSNNSLKYSIWATIAAFLLGVFGYFQYIFTYNEFNLKKQLIDVLVATLLLSSAWLFVFGLLMAIVNPNHKKIGVTLIITSIIVFIIGFGTCFANFSLGNMH